MEKSIAEIRKDYAAKTLLEQDVAADPVQQFRSWWKEAIDSNVEEVNAMTLATASVDGFPSARIVLLKDISDAGFSFFTNYDSFKGQQLLENPKACLVFFWKELERQVRITGLAEKLSKEESEEYFNSRPVGSRISAMASPQSRVVENREWLDAQYQKIAAQGEEAVQKPAYWGGYRVKPVIVEFWQGRPSRLHDRIQYTLEEGSWKIESLAP